ncbi:hypothetical protein QTS76_01955, partial [Micromonospora sp. b486]|nr:hypothetical protein [Micromonospora sp. b486]
AGRSPDVAGSDTADSDFSDSDSADSADFDGSDDEDGWAATGPAEDEDDAAAGTGGGEGVLAERRPARPTTSAGRCSTPGCSGSPSRWPGWAWSAPADASGESRAS